MQKATLESLSVEEAVFVTDALGTYDGIQCRFLDAIERTVLHGDARYTDAVFVSFHPNTVAALLAGDVLHVDVFESGEEGTFLDAVIV